MPLVFLSRSDLIKKVARAMRGGWKYKGSVYVFNKELRVHYYEILLERGEETMSLLSRSQFPHMVDAGGNIVKCPNRNEEELSSDNY